MRNRAASSRIIILSWIIPLSPTRQGGQGEASSRYLCTSGTVLVAADSCHSSADSESPRATAMCAIIMDEIESMSEAEFVQIFYTLGEKIFLHLSRLISNNFVYNDATYNFRYNEYNDISLSRMEFDDFERSRLLGIFERFFFVFLFFFFETYKFDVAGEEGEKRRCSCGAVSRWPY